MNIKKITVLLSTALFACHTNIFPMKKNQFLARIKSLNHYIEYIKIKGKAQLYKGRLQWKTKLLKKSFALPNLKIRTWVIVEKTEKEDRIVKIVQPNFKAGDIYCGKIDSVYPNYTDSSTFALVYVKKRNIPYPIQCYLEKGINRNDLVPNKTGVEIKITDTYTNPVGKTIRIIGILPKRVKKQEQEAEIERGEFVAEEVLPQKEVETKKIKLKGKTIHVPPYLLKKGEE